MNVAGAEVKQTVLVAAPVSKIVAGAGKTTVTNGPAPAAQSLTKVGTITHGWRWYRVEGNRLLSPIVHMFRHVFELPRDGLIDDTCYFVPGVDDIFWTQVYLRHQNRYEFALTFGRVEPPFELDPHMPHIHSISCSRYSASVIVSDNPQNFIGAYDLPIILNDRKPASLLAIQQYWGAPAPAPLGLVEVVAGARRYRLPGRVTLAAPATLK